MLYPTELQAHSQTGENSRLLHKLNFSTKASAVVVEASVLIVAPYGLKFGNQSGYGATSSFKVKKWTGVL
jgi:hypothetical protein